MKSMSSALGTDHIQVTGIPQAQQNALLNPQNATANTDIKDSNTQMVFYFLLTSVNKYSKDPRVFDDGLMFTLFHHRLQLVLLSEQNHYTISPIKHPKCKLPTLSIVNGQLIRVTK